MYIQTNIHTPIHVHTYIHTYIHTYLHTYLHTYIHTFIHTYIHTYINTYMHTFIHTYIHSYYIQTALILHACLKRCQHTSIFRDTDTISSLFARRQVSLLHAGSLLVFIERALVGAGGLQVCIWYCILERDWTVAVLKLHSCQWDIWLCCQVLLSDVSWLSMNVLAALF